MLVWMFISVFTAFSSFAPGTMPQVQPGGIIVMLCTCDAQLSITVDETGTPINIDNMDALTGKAMAVGIALHMGTLGLWSVLANTAFCLTVPLLCVTSVVMCWQRRPSSTVHLAPPPMPSNMRSSHARCWWRFWCPWPSRWRA